MLSGLSPGRFLAADPSDPNDPFRRYKQAWPWVREVIEDIEGAALVASRGFYAVIPPVSKRYTLQDEHYSYVVFNSHFDNIRQDGAFLVPTRLLMDQLRNGLVPLSEYSGFSPELSDLCGAGLSAEALRNLGALQQIPVLNLSWPSNVGGLMRAFPPNRPPLHEWEARSTTSFRDVAGHVHHSFIAGRYISNLSSSELRERLAPLIAAHTHVRDLSENLQALFTLFLYAEAAHSKGQFLPPAVEAQEEAAPNEEDEAGEPQRNPDAARQIRHSLEWYQRGEQRRLPREMFPVLAIVPTARLSPSSEEIVPILDTADFSTVVQGKKHYLLKEVQSQHELYEQHAVGELARKVLDRLIQLRPDVSEVFERMGRRMRLLHRDVVYQSRNPEGGDRHAQSSASTQ
ncbi:MAG: hypothetical protein EBZ48_01505 [Proteobacteria bacterium]|nr:hypothetical protein [Pseudomonadota bacterium]